MLTFTFNWHLPNSGGYRGTGWDKGQQWKEPWPGSSVVRSIISMHQGWGFDPPMGRCKNQLTDTWLGELANRWSPPPSHQSKKNSGRKCQYGRVKLFHEDRGLKELLCKQTPRKTQWKPGRITWPQSSRKCSFSVLLPRAPCAFPISEQISRSVIALLLIYLPPQLWAAWGQGPYLSDCFFESAAQSSMLGTKLMLN